MAEQPGVAAAVDAEGLARARAGGVSLVPWDAAWPARFAEARAAILAACEGVVLGVEHIGSTSIPGIGAKPYLDIMPGLRTFEDGERMVAAMASLGYVYRGEYGISGRHYFSKHIHDDPHMWKHNVHSHVIGCADWERHVAFRDALRADDALRDEYWRLKLELAARHPADVQAYADAKSEFVDRVIAAHGGPPRPPG